MRNFGSFQQYLGAPGTRGLLTGFCTLAALTLVSDWLPHNKDGESLGETFSPPHPLHHNLPRN